MFQHVGLLWIIKNNIQLKFEIDVQVNQCLDKGPWYNTTICTTLNGQIFECYLKTVSRDRYYFMCGVDKYDKERVPITYDASSDSIIPMTSKSIK